MVETLQSIVTLVVGFLIWAPIFVILYGLPKIALLLAFAALVAFTVGPAVPAFMAWRAWRIRRAAKQMTIDPRHDRLL